MKIAINARYLTVPYSGIGQYTFNLLTALASIDQQNEYLLFVPWPVEHNFGPNFKIIDIRELKLTNKDFLSRLWWEQVQLGLAIRRYKPDIYHSFYQSMPYGSDKIPSIVTIHDAIPWRFPFQRKDLLYRWYSDLSKKSCQRARSVLAVSETAKSDLTLVYRRKPEDIIVTYQSINQIYQRNQIDGHDIQKVKEKFGLDKPFVLYTGGFKRHKNLRFMIKAFANAIEKYNLDINLVIPGQIRSHSGLNKDLYFNPKELQRYAQKKAPDRVKFIGYVEIADLATLYRAADVFMSLSLYEGFGLPPLEAMASGTPVIVSNIGAYPEIIGDGGTIVYPHGIGRIGKALNRLFTDKDYYAEMTKKAAERVEFFDQEKIAQKVLQIYRDTKINYSRDNN